MVKKSPLDLGFTRALIRQAKARKIEELIPAIISHFDYFLPVVNNIVLYLNDVTNDRTLPILTSFFSKWVVSNSTQNELPRYWIEWYITRHPEFLKNKQICDFLFSSPNVITQARAAVLQNNLSWIRSKKSAMLTSGSWERRAILYASQILPTDERKHWLQQIEKDSPYILDKCISKWLRKRLNTFDDFEDDIPF